MQRDFLIYRKIFHAQFLRSTFSRKFLVRKPFLFLRNNFLISNMVLILRNFCKKIILILRKKFLKIKCFLFIRKELCYLKNVFYFKRIAQIVSSADKAFGMMTCHPQINVYNASLTYVVKKPRGARRHDVWWFMHVHSRVNLRPTEKIKLNFGSVTLGLWHSIYRVYKKRVKKFEIALNFAKQLRVRCFRLIFIVWALIIMYTCIWQQKRNGMRTKFKHLNKIFACE
jgi:hypothetical protein